MVQGSEVRGVGPARAGLWPGAAPGSSGLDV